MIMAEQLTPTLTDLNGTYFGESASFTNNYHTICGNGSGITMDGQATFTMNSPWTGFASMDVGASQKIDRISSMIKSGSTDLISPIIALMAGAGVYVSRSVYESSAPYAPTPWGFEIGTRISAAGC